MGGIRCEPDPDARVPAHLRQGSQEEATPVELRGRAGAGQHAQRVGACGKRARGVQPAGWAAVAEGTRGGICIRIREMRRRGLISLRSSAHEADRGKNSGEICAAAGDRAPPPTAVLRHSWRQRASPAPPRHPPLTSPAAATPAELRAANPAIRPLGPWEGATAQQNSTQRVKALICNRSTNLYCKSRTSSYRRASPCGPPPRSSAMSPDRLVGQATPGASQSDAVRSGKQCSG